MGCAPAPSPLCRMAQALGSVPILAEDLGVITKDVVQLRWACALLPESLFLVLLPMLFLVGVSTMYGMFCSLPMPWQSSRGMREPLLLPRAHARREAIGAPGMVVLQFAWGGGPSNTHLPHNHYENAFCYPGGSWLVGWVGGLGWAGGWVDESGRVAGCAGCRWAV